MSAGASTKWFWSDWLGDQEVRRLTPAERGVWIDLLGLMAAASPVGYLCDGKGNPISDAELARVTNAGTVEEVRKLVDGILEKGVASRDRSGRLLNRRMVRDVTTARKKSEAGKLGGQATAEKHWGKPSLPQHVPRHLLQQGCYAPIPYQERNKTSSFGAARAKAPARAGPENAHGVGPGAPINGHSLEKQPECGKPPTGGGAGLLVEAASRPPHEIFEKEKKATADEEPELARIRAKAPSELTLGEINMLQFGIRR
jgi:hypothetical protein